MYAAGYKGAEGTKSGQRPGPIHILSFPDAATSRDVEYAFSSTNLNVYDSA